MFRRGRLRGKIAEDGRTARTRSDVAIRVIGGDGVLPSTALTIWRLQDDLNMSWWCECISVSECAGTSTVKTRT